MKSIITTAAGFLALNLIWGSLWAVNDWIAAPPLWLGAVHLSIGVFLIALLALVFRSPLPSFAGLRANFLLGLMLIAVPFAVVSWTNMRSVVVLPMVIYGCVPLAVALLETRMTTTPIPWRAIQSSLIGAGGLALLLSNGLSVSPSQIWLVGLILLAVGSHAVGLVFAKAWLRNEPLLTSIATQLAAAAAILWLLSSAFEKHQTIDWTQESWISLGVIGVAGSGAGYLLFLWLLKEWKAREIATVHWLLPVVAIVEGAIAARQLPPWSIVVAAGVILGSVGVLFGARSALDEGVTLKVTVPPFDERGENLR